MSSSEWREVKLGDLLEVSSSKRIYAKEYVESGVPFYRSKEIIEKSKGNDVSTELFISEERYNEIKNKFDVPNYGDILLTSVGTLGIPYIVKNEKFYFKDGNLTWLKNFGNDSNNLFLYYWILSPYGVNQINSKCIGSTQKALTIDTLKKFDLNLPPLPEQKAIAHILSTLDEIIEVNNQINKTLENIAQTIFKQWFVDFEFPNGAKEPYKSSGGEMVESELGMIPKGWEVTKLDEICNFISGYSYKGNELVASNNAMITIKNFDRNGGFKLDGYKEISISDRVKDKHFVSIFDILVAHTDLTQNAEIIGNPILVTNTMSYKKIIFSMDTVKVDPIIENYRFYIYGLLLDSNFKGYALGNMNGTTVLHLSKKALPDYKFVKASNDLIERYNYLVKPLYEKIINIYSENIALNKLRDSLLPKLMSGEIRVPIEEN